jgi:hypothetical protein
VINKWTYIRVGLYSGGAGVTFGIVSTCRGLIHGGGGLYSGGGLIFGGIPFYTKSSI